MASPAWSYLALMAVVIALLVTVAIGLAYDKRSRPCRRLLGGGFALLRGVAAGLMALHAACHAAASPCCGWPSANIYRPAR